MRITFDVGGIVDALGDKYASVAAGVAGLSRPVSRAQMAVTPSQLWNASAHELVVAAAETVSAGEASDDDLVRHLCSNDAGALAIRLDEAETLASDLLESADEHGFPIITFPATTPLDAVTTLVHNALLDAQKNRMNRVLEIHQAFGPVVLSAGGIAEIVAVLFDLLARPIAVIDDGKDLIAAVPPGDAVWSASAIRGEDDSIARHSIWAGTRVYGEIIVDTDGAALDDDQMLALQQASVAIAIRLSHGQAAASELDRFATLSLEELVSGRSSNPTDVAERAISFGWDLNRRRAVLLASIDPPTDRETLPGALSAIAAAARATLGHDAVVWTRAAAVAALLAPGSDDVADRRQLAELLRAELDRTVHAVTVSVGVGRCVSDPLLLPQSYLEASRSVDVGRWVKGRHATEVYDDLGLERLLASASADDLAEFVGHAIGPLLDYDRSNKTELVATLGTWLETHNMAESARRLFVHYNTLKNRLDRVEAVLGPVLDDPSRSLECQVAIHVFHHYDGPWTDGRVDLRKPHSSSE